MNFIDRDISLLRFNERVCSLSTNEYIPLIERIKFLGIYLSNTDEFMMVKIGMLMNERNKLIRKHNDTSKIDKKIDDIISNLKMDMDMVKASYNYQISNLINLGYNVTNYKTDINYVKEYYDKYIEDIITPQIIEEGERFPFINNKSVYLFTIMDGKKGKKKYGLLKIPDEIGIIQFTAKRKKKKFALPYEFIYNMANKIFPGSKQKCLFRITRNADIDFSENHDSMNAYKYSSVINDFVMKRKSQMVTSLWIYGESKKEISKILSHKIMVSKKYIYNTDIMIDSKTIFALANLPKSDNDAKMTGLVFPNLKSSMKSVEDINKILSRRDLLLSYPYNNMDMLIQLLEKASYDPNVESIRITIYRVAKDSKIMKALINAAKNGKNVEIVVELRARFDEENNVYWAKELEDAGCSLYYGFNNMKVHAKFFVITKKKGDTLEYISQIATGNYNESTSNTYVDLSYITKREEIGKYLVSLFDGIISKDIKDIGVNKYISVSPFHLKQRLIDEIEVEMDKVVKGKDGYIFFKCNSIGDKEIMEKLTEAANLGVKVDLVVRGVCCIYPVANMEIRSIVGRYLEHSRIYAFGSDESSRRIYIGSADMLPRNTEKRIEIIIQVDGIKVKKQLNDIIKLYLNDNVNSYLMNSNGIYQKVFQYNTTIGEQTNPINAQIEQFKIW